MAWVLSPRVTSSSPSSPGWDYYAGVPPVWLNQLHISSFDVVRAWVCARTAIAIVSRYVYSSCSLSFTNELHSKRAAKTFSCSESHAFSSSLVGVRSYKSKPVQAVHPRGSKILVRLPTGATSGNACRHHPYPCSTASSTAGPALLASV